MTDVVDFNIHVVRKLTFIKSLVCVSQYGKWFALT